MIELACFVLLLVLIVMRCRRAVGNRMARPAWLATGLGALSLTTYGPVIPAAQLDQFLGDANALTLVRDLCATAAFWFFREAVAGYADAPANRSRWGLGVFLLSFAVPFIWITDRQYFSTDFIETRIDHAAVWLYGSIYMTTLIWLSLSTMRLARHRPGRPATAFIIGYTLTTISCLMEIAYLGLAHFGVGGQAFRHSMYYASELPFFTGVIIIVGVIFTISIRARLRVIQPRFRVTERRLNTVIRKWGTAPNRAEKPSASTPRQRAYEALIEAEAIQARRGTHLAAREHRWIQTAQRRLHLAGAPPLINFDAQFIAVGQTQPNEKDHAK